MMICRFHFIHFNIPSASEGLKYICNNFSYFFIRFLAEYMYICTLWCTLNVYYKLQPNFRGLAFSFLAVKFEW